VPNENYKNEKEVLVAHEMEAAAHDPSITDQETLKHLVKTFKESYNIKLSEKEDDISAREVEDNIQAADTIARDRMLENMSAIKENDLESIQLSKKVSTLDNLGLVTAQDHEYVAIIGDEEKVKNVIKKVLDKKAEELFAPEIAVAEEKLKAVQEFKNALSGNNRLPNFSHRSEVWHNFTGLDQDWIQSELEKKANLLVLKEKFLEEDSAYNNFFLGKDVISPEYLIQAFSEYLNSKFPEPYSFNKEAEKAYNTAKEKGEIKEDDRSDKFFQDWYAKKFKNLLENAPINTAFDAHEIKKHVLKPPAGIVEFAQERSRNGHERADNTLSSFVYQEEGKLRNINEIKGKYKDILHVQVDVDWTKTTPEYKSYKQKHDAKEPLAQAGMILQKIEFKSDLSINEEGEVVFKDLQERVDRNNEVTTQYFVNFQKEVLSPEAAVTKPLFGFGDPKPKHETILNKVAEWRATTEALYARAMASQDFEQNLLDEVNKTYEQVFSFNSNRTDRESLRQYTSKDKKPKEENQIREELEKQNVMKVLDKTANVLFQLKDMLGTRKRLSEEKAKIEPYSKFNGENLFKQLNLKGYLGRNIYGANHHIDYGVTEDEKAIMNKYYKASRERDELVKYVPNELK